MVGGSEGRIQEHHPKTINALIQINTQYMYITTIVELFMLVTHVCDTYIADSSFLSGITLLCNTILNTKDLMIYH